jgi:hydroxymethylglutaryl-CoA lyase
MKNRVVQIVEVGPRDGLQNEKEFIKTEIKTELARGLIRAGLKRIEIGSFVSPKWVPQMADSAAVIDSLKDVTAPTKKSKNSNSAAIHLSALVPNLQGMNQALAFSIPEVAIFASASESSSKKNINCSITESFARFAPVFELARKNKIRVRAHLSVSFGCPYEGEVSEAKVIRLAKKLYELGCFEISIADTIGVAHAGQVESLFTKMKKVIPVRRLAGHFHNTRGQALANILTAYRLGVRVFDSSLGGLGGCPYSQPLVCKNDRTFHPIGRQSSRSSKANWKN